MAWGINKVELVDLAVAGLIVQGDTLGLDRNTAFTLDIHGIEYLFIHLPRAQPAAVLYETICQSGFTVIDMGNNRKITYVSKVAHLIRLDSQLGLGQTQRPPLSTKKRAIVPQWGYNRHGGTGSGGLSETLPIASWLLR